MKNISSRKNFEEKNWKKMEETNFASRIKKILRIKDFRRNFAKEKNWRENEKYFKEKKFRREIEKNGGNKICIQN